METSRNMMEGQKMSAVSKTKQDVKTMSSETDSSISMTFDSASDCGYKSGEISSMSTSTSECISSPSISECSMQSGKLDQSVTFDSGLVSDCFSPVSSENLSMEKLKSTEQPTSQMEKKENYILRIQDIFSQDKDGDTILHLAIVEARSDIIFPLIQLAPHPDLLDVTNDLFQSLLHLSVLTGKSNIVRRLVVVGATLDMQDHNGNTPLHLACRQGDLDCVQAMLAPVTKYEIEEAHCSYQIYPQDHDLSYLINMKNYDGQTCVHLAAAGGFLKVMECLYNNNADMNDQDGKTGRTALHYAIETANLKLVELLLSKGTVDSRVHNYSGKSPTCIAYGLQKRYPAKTRQDILDLFKTTTSFLDASSEYDSESSGDEVEIESLLQNSRVLNARKGC